MRAILFQRENGYTANLCNNRSKFDFSSLLFKLSNWKIQAHNAFLCLLCLKKKYFVSCKKLLSCGWKRNFCSSKFFNVLQLKQKPWRFGIEEGEEEGALQAKQAECVRICVRFVRARFSLADNDVIHYDVVRTNRKLGREGAVGWLADWSKVHEMNLMQGLQPTILLIWNI